jgi:hypothetical protein
MAQASKSITNKDQFGAITCERFVGFIDIMGFKEMVARTAPEALHETMLNIYKRLREMERIRWEDDYEKKLVISIAFSDSIMIFSKDDTAPSYDSILCSMAAVSHELFVSSVPHKGAMAHGILTLDTVNSIFFGQPLIDAYLLQEQLLFYGIVLDGSIEKMHNQYKDVVEGIIHEHICPFKSGVSRHLTVQPLFINAEEDELKQEEERFFKGVGTLRYRTSGGLRKYIDATENYFNQLKSLKHS